MTIRVRRAGQDDRGIPLFEDYDDSPGSAKSEFDKAESPHKHEEPAGSKAKKGK